jgi:hypothetical protein
MSSTLYVVGFGQGEVAAMGGAAAGAVSTVVRPILSMVPANVAEAREWIRSWRVQQLERKVPEGTRVMTN